MKAPLVVLSVGLLALLPLSAQAKIERVVDKTFTVAPGGIVHVQTQGGDVRVEIGDDTAVKVHARERFRAGSEAEADEIAQHLKLVIEQSGNEVTASAKYEGPSFRSFWGGGSSRVQVDFTVTVPRNFRGDLKTSGGDIGVGDLGGDLTASTSGGDVRTGRIDGEVDLHTSGGDIQVAEAKRKLRAVTSGGNIRVGSVTGSASVSTSGGDIRIEGASGTIDAHTSGGNVAATFVDTIPADCSLRTSGGDVRVAVPSKASFRLDAGTSGGSVRVNNLAIAIDGGSYGKSRLTGAVNGGGPVLHLRTSGGSIHVDGR